MKPEEEITIANQFAVGRQTGVEGIVIQIMPMPAALTDDQAINLACWLVAMAGFNGKKRFDDLYQRVINT